MDTIQQIESILFERYRTSFSVSKDKYGYMILPYDNNKLARELEVEIDSQDYWTSLEEIEKVVNLLFT